MSWDPAPLGLGGWSLDVLRSYDSANRILVGGDGSWRFAEPLSLPSGEIAVPSFDGGLVYVFDAAGRHARTVHGILGADLVSFSYDDVGRLRTAKGSLEGRNIDLTVERDADGTASALIGTGGVSTEPLADGAQHLMAVRHPDGGSDGLIADANGLITLQADPAGGVTQFAYDEAGRLAEVNDPDWVTSRYSRTESSTEIEVTLAHELGDASVFRARMVDSDLERTYVAPGGPTTTVTSAPDGQQTVTLPNGTSLTIGEAPEPFWGLAAPLQTPVEETRSDGVVHRSTVEVAAQREPGSPLVPTSWSRTTTIDGDAYVDRLDPARQAIVSVDPLGHETVRSFDDLGRLVSYSSPGQRAAAYTYDELGRLASDTRGTGADAAVTTYDYGPDGRLTVTRPDGTTEILLYDARGRLVQQMAGDASTLLSSYDAAGRAILVRPGAAQSTTLGYSPAGRPTGYVPPVVAGDGSYELREYDDAGRLIGVSGPGIRDVTLAYDDAGRRTSVAFDGGRIDTAYDPATGRPATTTAPDGVITTYTYVGDLVSNIGWSGPVAGAVGFEFDARGRPIAESVNSGARIGSSYDGAGRVTAVGGVEFERDASSGLAVAASVGVTRVAWQYDANGWVVGASATAGGNSLLAWAYERDIFGRITRVSEATGAGERVTEYGYDGAGRLISVAVDGATVEQSVYDQRGNRISVSGPGSSVAAEYDARDQLRRWASATYEYEPDGTLARQLDGGATTSYDFDDLGNLRAVALPDGRQVEYIVDGSGRPIGRRVNGQLTAGYLYRPDGLIAAELDAAGQLVARFARDGAGRLVSMDRDGATLLIVTDALGSPRLVVDSTTGEVAQAVEYDAWGRVVSDSKPGFQPFGFAGGLLDPDSGLVHFGAREYDPVTGRWIEPDPMRFESGGSNLYEYAAGDPVNRSDPSGLEPPVSHDCTADTPCTHETWHEEEDGSYTVCRPAGGGQECYPWYGPPPKAGEPPPSGGEWPPGGPPPPEDPDAPPAPSPPDPGKKGGGFWCIGICFPPGGGICIIYCSSGDPHVRTADGLAVGFQGAGEYLMLASADGTVALQVRQEPPGSATLVTVTTAVAASVAGDRVGIYLDEGSPLLVNGAKVEGEDASLSLPKGGTLVRHGTSFVVEWPDGSRLTVSRNGNHLDYGFAPDAGIAPTLVGLMGTPNGDVADDLVSRDGALRLDTGQSDFFEQLHGPFGDSWRIGQDESLFDYAAGDSTATFTLADIPHAPATVDALGPAERAAAEALCKAVGVASEPTLSDCIVDVGLTGDSSFASSAAAAAASLSAAPPAAAPIPISVGQTVTGLISVPDELDRYTFTGTAGQAVYLDALGVCTTDISWKARAPSGDTSAQLFACNDVGRYEIAETGTFTVEVFAPTGSDDTGSYVFVVRPASAAAAPTPIISGQHVSGEVAQVGDQPSYSFEGKADELISVDASGPCIDGLSYRIVDPNGLTFAFEPICADEVPRQLDTSGTYLLVIVSTEAVTGPYSFVVTSPP